MPRLQMPTTFLRVEGPRDSATCAFCRDWVGREIPQEQRTTFVASHHRASGHGCRCSFIPVSMELGFDPSCEWA